MDMNPRQVAFVRAALADELTGIAIPPETLDAAALAATRAAYDWTFALIEGAAYQAARQAAVEAGLFDPTASE
jgi:hypothetical protein